MTPIITQLIGIENLCFYSSHNIFQDILYEKWKDRSYTMNHRMHRDQSVSNCVRYAKEKVANEVYFRIDEGILYQGSFVGK